MTTPFDQIPWDAATNHSTGYYFYIGVLSVAAILNGFTFFANIFHPKLKNEKPSILVRYLNLEDLLFSIICLSQCSLNFDKGYVYGHEMGCRAQ
eukprot:Pgem_evm1s13477